MSFPEAPEAGSDKVLHLDRRADDVRDTKGLERAKCLKKSKQLRDRLGGQVWAYGKKAVP